MKNLKDYLRRSDVVISCETDEEAKTVIVNDLQEVYDFLEETKKSII